LPDGRPRLCIGAAERHGLDPPGPDACAHQQARQEFQSDHSRPQHWIYLAPVTPVPRDPSKHKPYKPPVCVCNVALATRPQDPQRMWPPGHSVSSVSDSLSESPARHH
jgi:hypothetical protein